MSISKLTAAAKKKAEDEAKKKAEEAKKKAEAAAAAQKAKEATKKAASTAMTKTAQKATGKAANTQKTGNTGQKVATTQAKKGNEKHKYVVTGTTGTQGKVQKAKKEATQEKKAQTVNRTLTGYVPNASSNKKIGDLAQKVKQKTVRTHFERNYQNLENKFAGDLNTRTELKDRSPFYYSRRKQEADAKAAAQGPQSLTDYNQSPRYYFRSGIVDPMTLAKSDSITGRNPAKTAPRLTEAQKAQAAARKKQEENNYKRYASVPLSDADKKLPENQRLAIQRERKAWEKARDAGDIRGMNRAHDAAESIRRAHGYTGGKTGDEYYSPSLTVKERIQLNKEGEAALKRARLTTEQTSPQVAKDQAAQKEMEVLGKAGYQSLGSRGVNRYRLADEAMEAERENNLSFDAHGRPMAINPTAEKSYAGVSAVGYGVGGALVKAAETAVNAARNNERTRNMSQWAKDAQDVERLESRLRAFDENGYDAVDGLSREALEKKLAAARYARQQLNQMQVDPRSDYFDPTRAEQQGLPTTAKESLGERWLRTEQEQRALATKNLGKVGTFLTDTAISMGQMLPSVGAAMIPGVGPVAGAALMGGQAMGQKAYQVEQNGATSGEALIRGLGSGLIEMATEAVPLTRLAKIAKGGTGKKLLGNMLTQAGIEATEESLAYIGNYAADWAARDPNREISLAGLAENALAGAIMGGAFGGVGSIAGMPARGGTTVPLGEQGSVMSTPQSPPVSALTQAAAELTAKQKLDQALEARRAGMQAADPAGRENAARQGGRIATSPAAPRNDSGGRIAAPSVTARNDGGAREVLERNINTLGKTGQRGIMIGYRDGSDVSAYRRGFQEVYDQALAGKTDKEITRSRALDDMQNQAAVLSGRMDRKISLERDRKAAQEAKVAKNDGLHDLQTVSQQVGKKTAREIDQVAKAFGQRVRYVSAAEMKNPAAQGEVTGNEVRINRDYEGADAVTFIAGHEFTHRMQELAPEAYRSFRDFVMESEGNLGKVDAIIAAYERAGERLTRDQAMDEIAADAAGSLFTDTNVMQDFIQRNRQDYNVLQRAWQAIKDIAAKLTGKRRQTADENLRLLENAMDEAAKAAKTLEVESGIAQNGESRYLIREDEQGRKYVDVDVDQHLFDGLSVPEMQTVAKREITNRFRGHVIGTDYTAYINKRSAEHYAYPANRRMDMQQKEDKMRASTELDHIVEASVFRKNVPDDGRHPEATGGLDKLDTVFQVQGRRYSAEITVLVTDKGRIFYDLTKFKDITEREIGQTQNSAAETSSNAFDTSIAEETEKSNTKMSIKSPGVTGQDAAQLARENQELRKKLDYWKSQVKRTDRRDVSPESVGKLARRIRRDYSTEMGADEIAERLGEIYNGITHDMSYNQAQKKARELSEDMIRQASVTEDYLYHEYEPMRKYFRDTPLVLSPADSGQITDFNDFRKMVFGKLRIRKGAQSNVDQVYQELSERWPEWFDEQRESTSLDQVERIAQVLGEVYSRDAVNPYTDDMAGPANFLATEIMDSFWDVPAVKRTFADRQQARVDREIGRRNEMRERYQAAIQNVREQRDRRIKEETGKRISQKKEMQTRQKERELRARITRHSRDLSGKLLRPSDNKHVPQELRGAVAKALESINLESVYTYDPETGKRSKNANGTPTRRTEAFQALRLEYRKIMGEESLVVDPELMDNLEAIEGYRGTPISAMNLEQLETIWDAVRAVEHSISTANKTLAQGRFATILEAARGLREDNSHKKAQGDWRGAAGKMAKLTGVDMMTPQAYFHRLGEAGDELFRMIRKGQDKQITILKEAQERSKALLKDADTRKLGKEKHTFTFGDESVTFTTAQVMSLYELMKRDQAVGHILVGGIRPGQYRSGMKESERAAPIRLEREQIESITNTLTKEQKALADGIQKILGGEMSRHGNEASMAVYGYEKFGEEHYFPIKTDKNQTYEDQAKNAQAGTLPGRGFTKRTVPNASNAVIIDDIFSVFSDHVAEMSTYAAYLPVMEDLKRVFNFRFKDGEGGYNGDVKSILETVYGKEGGNYWRKLTEDLNNGVKGTNDSPFSGLIGTYKASAIGANLRVIIQQPTSVLRALDEISLADFIAATGSVNKGTWERAKKYSPIAQWKSWGYFDAYTGRTVRELLVGDDSRMSKVNNALMAPTGAADSVAWSHLWRALEIETARKRKDLAPKSEAFYQAVADRFDQVIDRTQVVDGIPQRSQIMRSPDGLTKMATSFMAEPTKIYNMLASAAYDAQNAATAAGKRKAATRFARTGFALIASVAANAAAQSVIDALRDDDTGETWVEKFIQAFLGDEEEEGAKGALFSNLGQSFNPATYIPFIKDAWSLYEGYSVDRMDMESIERIMKEVTTSWKAFSGEGKITKANAISRLIGEMGRLVGLPTANIRRDVLAIYQTALRGAGQYQMLHEVTKFLYRIDNKNNANVFYDLAYAARKAGDLDAYKVIVEDMQEQMGKELGAIEKNVYTRLGEDGTLKEIDKETFQAFTDKVGTFSGKGKQEKIVAYIDGLSLTKEQKSALFRTQYESDKNNPWT